MSNAILVSRYIVPNSWLFYVWYERPTQHIAWNVLHIRGLEIYQSEWNVLC